MPLIEMGKAAERQLGVRERGRIRFTWEHGQLEMPRSSGEV